MTSEEVREWHEKRKWNKIAGIIVGVLFWGLIIYLIVSAVGGGGGRECAPDTQCYGGKYDY